MKKTIRISQTVWTHFVLFIKDVQDGQDVVHSVGYVGLPNVASLKENFDELKEDEDFKIDDIDSVYVDIVDKATYIEIMGDFKINVDDQ